MPGIGSLGQGEVMRGAWCVLRGAPDGTFGLIEWRS